MTSDSSVPSETSVEALRRLKEVETEWEAKLSAARAAAEKRIQLARDSAEALVTKVRPEVERQRETVLSTARSAAQSEADRIVRDGEAKARETMEVSAKLSPTARSKVLATVLAGFQSDARSEK